MNLSKVSLCTAMLLLSPLALADVAYHTRNPDRPFSEAVRVDDILYLSGQLGFDEATGALVEGGIANETKKTLENIKATLDKYGSSLSQVVKCTVYLVDIAEWGAMNEVYVTFFPVNPPARSALGTSGLALGARTEIECMATTGED